VIINSVGYIRQINNDLDHAIGSVVSSVISSAIKRFWRRFTNKNTTNLMDRNLQIDCINWKLFIKRIL
jgi:hypothetical protein